MLSRSPISPEQRAKERAERIAAQKPPAGQLARRVTMAGSVQAVAAKAVPHRSEKWLGAVRELNFCVLCGAEGVQAAHRNEGKAMSAKVSDCLTAALCPTCHAEIDQGAALTREERRARLDRAIVLTMERLVQTGKVRLL